MNKSFGSEVKRKIVKLYELWKYHPYCTPIRYSICVVCVRVASDPLKCYYFGQNYEKKMVFWRSQIEFYKLNVP